MTSKHFRLIGLVAAALVVAVGVWLWMTAGRESTDDAQVDAHVTPVAARVGGTVVQVNVVDNQAVEAGAVLVQLDRRDYEVALDRARADLATAQASAVAATANVPIASTAATSNVTTARGGITEAQHGLDAAQARVASAQARLREQEANAARDARDVERLKGLLAKDEISQQQYDAAAAKADASRAAADSARSQVQEAQTAIGAAQSRVTQAGAELRTAQTGPEQVSATRAQAEAAQARVKQAEAAVKQAELNLEYTTLRATVKGIVSRKSVEPGQVIQPGQPLMAVIPLEQVWVTANYKETQLAHMRPGQPALIKADAYGGGSFKGHVDSIAAATGSRFSLLPPENATGNFVKVVQRVPVKIVLEQGQESERVLRPGMSVTATVYTK